MIYKIILTAILLSGFLFLANYAYDYGYETGYEQHKYEASNYTDIVRYTDLRYVAGTYKRLYEQCAGDNIQPEAIKNLLLNLEFGELWLI